MDYLLDTNIIIIYSRDNDLSKKIESQHNIFSDQNRLFISVVTQGEIEAVIKKSKLGQRRKSNIHKILNGIRTITLNYQEIISRYGDIDAFSQGKLESRLGNFTSRNMGKNDMWIAATASVFNLKLFTTDKDFDHLDKEYLELVYLDLSSYRAWSMGLIMENRKQILM